MSGAQQPKQAAASLTTTATPHKELVAEAVKTPTPDRLARLGLKAASSKVGEKLRLKQKLTLAYEHHRYVRKEKIAEFNKKLKAETLKRQGKANVNLYEKYDKLVFIELGKYDAAPPVEALDLLEKAQTLVTRTGEKVFDEFEVCKVESVVEYKDPIIFGRVKGCSDRFYVAQWDTDVSIQEILQDHEG